MVRTTTRRLAPLLLAVLVLAPLAGPASAVTAEPVAAAPADRLADAVQTQAGRDLVLLTNSQRTAQGLVALRMDPDLMAIARARAEVMAREDVMGHAEPDGRTVIDRLTAANVTSYGFGEILAWNNYPTVQLSIRESIRVWMASPSHRTIMLSDDYNYIGYGAAVSASGKWYYAGVFVKQADKTVPWARLGAVSIRPVDVGHVRVTVRWSGGDIRLQVLTSGLRYFQIERRTVGGGWRSWVTTTATARSATFTRGVDQQVRVRARDRAGNWGAWRTISIDL